MKEIKAIIQPHMLEKVMDALHDLAHFPGITVSDCQGQGRGCGIDGSFVPTEGNIFLAKMIKLEIFCSDAFCDQLVATLQRASHTGNAGDGVIMVADLSRVIRVRSGQEQGEAV